MLSVLVGTSSGCLSFAEDGKAKEELSDHAVGSLLAEADGTCLGIVDSKEVWRRSAAGAWSYVANAGVPIQSICMAGETLYLGGDDEAVLLRMKPTGEMERVGGFDTVPGRNEWFAGGPPLGIRALTAAMDGKVLLAAVHVGGIPRSSDGGASWTPTIPVMFDVHEIRTHPRRKELVAAATAVGLCVSTDAGSTWRVLSEGFKGKTCLALALLDEEVLFSVQEGPFPDKSQVWRWQIASDRCEQVGDGLPAWLEGKVDTGWIAGSPAGAAVVDGEGSLWLSERGSRGWRRIATEVVEARSVAMLG